MDVDLKNYYNYNYVGTIYVGNPPQKVRCIFDTGSTNQWVLSSLCAGKRIANGVNMVFTPDQSSSYHPTNLACEVEFGSGSLKGFFAHDDIRIGEDLDNWNSSQQDTSIHV